ncbi:DUF2306 domain-containing protein [Devosia sp. CAU 1758]
MTTATSKSSGWLVLTALLILGFLPVLVAIGRMVMRFADFGATPEMVADTSRFFVMPAAVILHVIGGCLFALLGALQFSTSLRRGRWHRLSGRVLVVAGVVAALSALWLTQFYPHLGSEGPLLYWFRLAAGSGMLIFLLHGFNAARQRRFDAHRASMIRAYALGLGASTQMLIGIPWMLLLGEPTPIMGDVMLGSAWVINMAVAQWALKRRGAAGGQRVPAHA